MLWGEDSLADHVVVFMKRNSGLKKLKNLYKRYRYERLVLCAFFDWVLCHAANDVTILVCMDTVEGTFQKQDSSLVRVKEKFFPSKNRIAFALYAPKRRAGLERSGRVRTARRVSLFESDFVCVDEYVTPRGQRLLRHGLSAEEKKLALALVRRNMRSFLEAGKHTASFGVEKSMPDIFHEPATVDVVLWVRGELRGSIIFSAPTLTEAILEGSTRSARDGRFRPLHRDELNETYFEINILSDLHIPLPDVDLFHTVMTEKGYSARWRNKMGWYLPSVFNVTRFSGIADFLSRLATEKARIQADCLKFVSFNFFEVETFIDTARETRMQEMKGPLMRHSPAIQNAENMKGVASDMADWICRVQDPDGFLPQHIDPVLPAVSRRADWPRMAFTSFALGVYGQELNASKYLEAGDKTARFIGGILDDLLLLPPHDLALVHAYLGRLALVRGRKKEAEAHAQTIQKFLPEISFNPIVFLQVASLLCELLDEKHTLARKEEAGRIADRVLGEWGCLLASNQEISFAGFAELMPLLFALVHTGHQRAQEFNEHYKKIREWYLSEQYRSGAFPNTTHSAFTYTRGTGKIFEALAIDKENLGPCIKSLQWVSQFRYTEDSLFCVTPLFRDKVRGSLMHDSLDHRAWIDAVGHILIGASRLLRHASIEDSTEFLATEST